MTRTNDRRRGGTGSSPAAGLTLLEVTITVALLALILVGVLGALSTGALAQRSNTGMLGCQLLSRQVLEELKSVPYDGLAAFDGKSVDDVSGKYRATISVFPAATNLMELEVVAASREDPGTAFRLVTLISRPDGGTIP